MDQKEQFKKIGEKLEGLRSCMFITRDSSGQMRGRPMATQELEFDGAIIFMTDKRTGKCEEIKNDPNVCLGYAHSNGVRFVSVSGKASFSEDRAKIKELWNDFYKAWFEGPEDPNITLIEVKVSRVEYWDNKGGKVGSMADMAIGAVTGKANTLDENEVLTF